MADIDALTLPGYEAMAEKAKKDGTSALDFQKQIVAAQRQKGSDYLKDRASELKPAQKVAGDAPTAGASEEQEMAAYAKEMGGYARDYLGDGAGTMF